ncbi:MAG TPA: hypothetical protein VLJ86_20800 [Ramlibacter sp.]|nr:hypothetical protein [Ramlibacter sp.]
MTTPEEKARIKAELGALVSEHATPTAKQGVAPKVQAFMALAPSNAGRIVAAAFNVLGHEGRSPDVQAALAKQFMDSAELLNLGDMTEVESMFLNQAQALQVVFASLAHAASVATKAERHDALLQLALRAQANSRATLAALVDLKFPRQTVIAKQANIASGSAQQQINNGAPAPATASGTREPSSQVALPPPEAAVVVEPLVTAAKEPVSRARTRKTGAVEKKYS